jgi:2-iminobutanoate/2-iminopropanoate deaminase
MKSTRRSAALAALSAAAMGAAPQRTTAGGKQVHNRRKPADGQIPLYPEAVSCNGFVFVSGHGVNDVQGVKAQTTKVLVTIRAALENAGSSMQKVVKCNVFLANIEDYAEMNEAYRGRFGNEPPVRTTVAVAAIPLKGCLVEIEVVASA